MITNFIGSEWLLEGERYKNRLTYSGIFLNKRVFVEILPIFNISYSFNNWF